LNIKQKGKSIKVEKILKKYQKLQNDQLDKWKGFYDLIKDYESNNNEKIKD